MSISCPTFAAIGQLVLLTMGVGLGCGSSSDAGTGGGPVVLRVAAPHGLSDFDDVTGLDGATSAAQELVYEPVSAHAELQDSTATTARLRLLPSSPLSAGDVARQIRATGVRSARAADPEHVELVFENEEARKWFDVRAFVDSGPYRVEVQSGEMVRLRRRGKSAIDAIEIVRMSAEDEWRRLHGRQLDVIPYAEERRRDEFSALDSVRIVDLPPSSEICLYMNTRNPALSDVAVRRVIARALDRAAIARVACGTARCASKKPLPPVGAEVELPERLSLRVHEDYAEGIVTAKLVRQQLREVGIAVDVLEADLVSEEAFYERERTQLWVAPQSLTEFNFKRFVSPGSSDAPWSVTGYANEAYDEAVGRGDLAAAQAILDRDVPVVPLYVMRHFAVVDKKFCGDVKPEPYSWRWLADLRPCRKGETP